MNRPLLETPLSRRTVLRAGSTLIFASALAYAGTDPARADPVAAAGGVPAAAPEGTVPPYYTYTPNIPVNALPAADLAGGKPTSASSFAPGGNTPFNGTDGSLTSSWSASENDAAAWWRVDLRGYFDLAGTRIVWPESRPASSFGIEVSSDGENWTTVATGTDSEQAARERHDTFDARNVRFVRVAMTPADASGPVSIMDFQVYGDLHAGGDVALGKLAYASSGDLAAHAIDGNSSTVWTAEGLYWKTDLRGKHNLLGTEVIWADGGRTYRYTIDVSSDGKTWETVVDHAHDGLSGTTHTEAFAADDITHVRLRMIGADDDTAALTSFAVFGVLSPNTNVALAKPATASSGWAPANANDGKRDTIWVAGDGQPSWWKVDLERPHDLHSISTEWENGSAEYRFTIETSTDEISWTTIVDRSQNTSTQQPFTDAVDVRAVRHVRVNFLGASGGWWGAIRECIILGLPSDDDQTPRDVAAGKPAFTNDIDGLDDRGKANDDSTDTKFIFASLGKPYHFQVDLRTEHDLTGAAVTWNAFGTSAAYEIQVSRDATEWTTVRNTRAAGADRHDFAAERARFVRLRIPSVGDSYESAISDLQIFGARASAIDLAAGREITRAADAQDQRQWRVELGGLAEITSVDIAWSGTKNFTGYRLEVSSDAHVWITVAQIGAKAGAKERSGTKFRANNVRFVRVLSPEPQNGQPLDITGLAIHGRLTRDESVLNLEAQRSFQYFWDLANTNPASGGYGLIAESTARLDGAASVSGAGFGLAALPVGVERGWISSEEGYARALGTLNTLLALENVRGVFYHYYSRQNGSVWVWPDVGKSEVGLIDTQLLFNGVIVAGEYFGGDVKARADELYRRVDWDFFRDPETNHYHMSYFPDEGIFRYSWNWSSEGKIMYLLGAGSPTHPVDPAMFYAFTRQIGTYDDYPSFVNTWFGSLFTYQYAEAIADFRGSRDREGVDWWRNSVLAGKTNRQYAINEDSNFRTFAPDLWGMVASGSPTGYNSALGAPPSGVDNTQHQNDGTLSPSGAAGSIAQDPEYATRVLDNIYYNHPKVWGEYGFTNAFNLDVEPAWYSDEELALDKGIGLFAIENNRSGLIWRLFMQNPHVQEGMKRLDITYTPSTTILQTLITEASFTLAGVKEKMGKKWKRNAERLRDGIAAAQSSALSAASVEHLHIAESELRTIVDDVAR